MDSTLAHLATWMPRQRWYAGKGGRPRLRLVDEWELPAPAGIAVRTVLVADGPVLYQVPLVIRPATGSTAEHTIGHLEPETVLIDGPHDPAYTRALLDLIIDEGSAPYTSSVLSGEQSNTSIIYRPDGGGTAIICKLFRQLHAGQNPDIELQTILAAAGSPYVPRVVGSTAGEWRDPATGEAVSGSLAFAQEFLPGVEDAWRVALRSAAADDDFAEDAHELGIATAHVHGDLARLLPTVLAGPAQRALITDGWRQRLASAAAEMPAIAERRAAIEAVYQRASDLPWPALERIHGDYHLGQVLRVPGRGWVLLDFEGEPLRPMPERRAPDLALRDVAGMLRSFDYVAGSLRQSHPAGHDAHGWASAAREAFLDGYTRASGRALPQSDPLLTALELDKAVYEALYETRNRPTWATIPLDAIARLAAHAAH